MIAGHLKDEKKQPYIVVEKQSMSQINATTATIRLATVRGEPK
jgi:hypothetical protein